MFGFLLGITIIAVVVAIIAAIAAIMVHRSALYREALIENQGKLINKLIEDVNEIERSNYKNIDHRMLSVIEKEKKVG